MDKVGIAGWMGSKAGPGAVQFSLVEGGPIPSLIPSSTPYSKPRAFSQETWPRCSPKLLTLSDTSHCPENSPRIAFNPFPVSLPHKIPQALQCSYEHEKVFYLFYKIILALVRSPCNTPNVFGKLRDIIHNIPRHAISNQIHSLFLRPHKNQVRRWR